MTFKENTDGNEWFVELSENTNTRGVDAFLVNHGSGERQPIQFKSSDDRYAAQAHYEKYHHD